MERNGVAGLQAATSTLQSVTEPVQKLGQFLVLLREAAGEQRCTRSGDSLDYFANNAFPAVENGMIYTAAAFTKTSVGETGKVFLAAVSGSFIYIFR